MSETDRILIGSLICLFSLAGSKSTKTEGKTIKKIKTRLNTKPSMLYQLYVASIKVSLYKVYLHTNK